MRGCVHRSILNAYRVEDRDLWLPLALMLTESMTTKHTIVVGGGVVGVSTAYYLAKRGVRVTLVEQNEVASGCSHGNAGQITPGHLPLPVPGTLLRNMLWLFKPSSPLFIAPRIDIELWKWLVRFQLACNHRHLRKATRVLCELGAASIEQYRQLRDEIGFRFQDEGRLEVCSGKKSFENAVQEAELLRSFGFQHQQLLGSEVNSFEPAIRSDVYGAIYYPDSAACDPHRFVETLATHSINNGVSLKEKTEVLDLVLEADRCLGVRTAEGDILGDEVVLAQGSWAARLSGRLKQALPIQPGKGYHLDLSAPSLQPTRPLVLLEERIFVTPMTGCLRLAGTMEFSGFNLHPRQTRLDMLVSGTSRYLPRIEQAEIRSEWCHLRPMTSDGMPVLGPLRQIDHLWLATGHGMLGLTQGPISGKLLSEWICDGKPSIDLDEVSPNRFS